MRAPPYFASSQALDGERERIPNARRASAARVHARARLTPTPPDPTPPPTLLPGLRLNERDCRHFAAGVAAAALSSGGDTGGSSAAARAALALGLSRPRA